MVYLAISFTADRIKKHLKGNQNEENVSEPEAYKTSYPRRFVL
jgi:hypothetical protein